VEVVGWPPAQFELERLLLSRIAELIPEHRRHLRIRSGGLTTHRMPQDRESQRAVMLKVLAAPGLWTTVRRVNSLMDVVLAHDAIALVVEGLSGRDASGLDVSLANAPSYLGAIHLMPEFELHHAVYLFQLPLRFRLFGRSAWLLHGADADPEIAGEDNRDYSWRDWLRPNLKPYGISEVDFQSIGLQESVFDPYDSPGHARTAGRASALLGSYYDAVVDELLIRSREADPRLIETLDAALHLLEAHHTRETLSQAALSCRRFLERLANLLYPPRDELVGGRKVGRKEYRNRLWAYAEERLGSDTKAGVVLASLTDVGGRIDALDKAANKGVHAEVDFGELHRLVLGLVLLTYDLLTLSAPTGTAAESYARELSVELHRLIKRAAERADADGDTD
jgi:hypothetical protein